jgi:hypothetical protein
MEESYNLNCKHEANGIRSEKYFCIKCGGIFINDKIFSIKSSKMKYSGDIPAMILYSEMRRNYEEALVTNSLLNWPKSFEQTSIDFINKRKNIIKKMKSLINKLKFKERTLQLAIYLMDLIVGREKKDDKGIKAEYVAIGCLALAGIFFNRNN